MSNASEVAQNGHGHRRSGNLLAILVLILVAVLVVSQRQLIYDYGRLYGYEPPSEIAALATATTMTDSARHDFYVNHPAVQDKTEFNQSCPNNGGEQTIVLGCYVPKQAGIYVYRVTDPQLAGVEEVTAAHEMLHAAYDRLGSQDRKNVDAMLQDYYTTLTDQRLKDIFAAYQKSEPNDLVNEMHSIFGTEVANLPPALEAYYKQYFTDRQKVVAFAAKYQGAFNSRKELIASYDQQLTSLKREIEGSQMSLDAQQKAIAAARQQLNQLLNSGQTEAYNAQVDSFNIRVQNYNSLLATTKAKIAEYNKLVETRNAVALETQNLAKELNSNSDSSLSGQTTR